MKAIFAAVVVFAVLVLASLSSVAPPPHAPAGSGLMVQASRQCPANSRLAGKACTCPEPTSWTGSECMQVWSSSERSVAGMAPPPPRLAVSGSDGNGSKETVLY